MENVKKVKKINPYYRELIKKTEIKRVAEHLTKRELTNILDLHYNFYWNCVTGRNEPSKNLADALEVYLKTPTDKVYETVFARRANEDRNKRTKRDDSGKELYHEELEIDHDLEVKVLKQLEEDNVFKAPVEADMRP